MTNHDILDKVLYVLCNPIAADLVDRLHDWPGASSLGHLGGKATTHRRPKYFFHRDGTMPKQVTLRAMVPSRITKNETVDAWRRCVRQALAERERAIRETRATKKRRVAGRKHVMRLAHTDAPASSTIRRGLRPAIACKDPARRLLELEALKEFRALYRIACESWMGGNRRAKFPTGTYRMLAFGVRCTALPA